MPHSPKVLGQKQRERGTQQRRRLFDQQRGSREERGYDWKWRKFREVYLQTVVLEDPFCSICHAPFGRSREIEIHHKQKISEHPELKYDRDNLQHTCKQCHSKLTAIGL